MRGQKYIMLEDTRNPENVNACKFCGHPLSVMFAQSSERYHVTVYQCRQCEVGFFTLSQIE